MVNCDLASYTYVIWRIFALFYRSNSAEETLSIKNGLSEQRSSSSNGHIDLCQDHENTDNENDLADKQGFNLGISS